MLVYDTLEQARMRLEHSVITVGERAFLIDGCSQRGGLGKIKLQGRFTQSSKTIRTLFIGPKTLRLTLTTLT